MNEVIDRVDEGRFVVEVDGQLSELVYRLEGTYLVLLHSEVPEALGGQGLGGMLVRAALDRARGEGLTVVPLCPFVRQWLERHPDEAARVPIDWERGR